MNKKGFTLLEILLVVAAIGILAGIVILALNPTKQLGDTRNAQRWSDVNTILNAVYQYSIDTDSLPADIDNSASTYQMIGTLTSGCDICAAETTEADCSNLSELITDEEYLVSLPYDPQSGSGGVTQYYINKSGNGRITVGSCAPEQGEVIEVTR